MMEVLLMRRERLFQHEEAAAKMFVGEAGIRHHRG
jgi:hypothetical protein